MYIGNPQILQICVVFNDTLFSFNGHCIFRKVSSISPAPLYILHNLNTEQYNIDSFQSKHIAQPIDRTKYMTQTFETTK